ncbi:MAG TPA: hypothetical protein VMB79_08565 [Jatrophihabitans sp.]|nr:hypothetical protein [Jatrophihabitans sp.]
MSQLDQLPAGAVVRARPWDVIGAGLGAPMVLWGFLGWFGTVGDSGGGMPGFYSGAGAAGIGLVLAASSLTLTLMLSGRAHDRGSPPAAVFLAGAAVIVILGGMVAKPDSATIQAGSVAGLLTALSQGAVLVRGWLQGSQKSVKAANVRALNAQQVAADQAAAAGFGGPPGSHLGPGPVGYPPGGQGWLPAAPGPGYQPPAPRYPQFPPGAYPAGRPPTYPAAPAGYQGGGPGPAGYPGAPPGYPAGGYPGHRAAGPAGYQGGFPGGGYQGAVPGGHGQPEYPDGPARHAATRRYDAPPGHRDQERPPGPPPT